MTCQDSSMVMQSLFQWPCSLCQVSSTVNLECQASSILMQNCLNGNVKYCQWFFAHVKYLQWWYQVSSTINILFEVSSTIYFAIQRTVNAYSYPYYTKPQHYQTTRPNRSNIWGKSENQFKKVIGNVKIHSITHYFEKK